MAAHFLALERLAPALASRPEPSLAGVETEAAVLVCLHEEAILLVRRQVHDGDKWSGHIGLPGGRREAGDEGLMQTALREAEEEVGFDALAHGRMLGCAGTIDANRRMSGDLRIAIYVAQLHSQPAIELSSEIAAVYWVPIGELRHGTASVPERPEPVPAYLPRVNDGELVVWGITYRILERLRALAGTDRGGSPTSHRGG
jgi:8-oxo-dGTP pyrophosphatase MutT (NUDIX family)